MLTDSEKDNLKEISKMLHLLAVHIDTIIFDSNIEENPIDVIAETRTVLNKHTEFLRRLQLTLLTRELIGE